jgi:hypothetical protein
MLNALAEAAHRVVPVVRKSKVRVESEGASVREGDSISGTGYKEYVAHAVRTTRTLKRGFERERRMGINRRMELIGAAAALSVSVEEELGGRTRSPCAEAAAARRAACRLR